MGVLEIVVASAFFGLIGFLVGMFVGVFIATGRWWRNG